MDQSTLYCICGAPADQHAGMDHAFIEKRPAYDPSTWYRAAARDVLRGGPPSTVYIQLEDRLQMTFLPSFGQATVTITARILRPDGVIIALQFSTTFAGAYSVSTSTFDLVEGFLLSVVLSTAVSNTIRGQIFGTAAIIRGTPPNAIVVQGLFADYLTSQNFAAFPGGRTAQGVDGIGNSQSVTIAAPAAGVELSITVGTRRRWRPRSIVFSLTTAVAVANREVTLVVDDGANIVAQIPSNFTQAASLTEKYCFALGTQTVKGSVTTLAVSPLPDVTMTTGWRIRTLTTAIQAADQYTAAQLMVEEWLE